jgi:nucleotide-binding universal stress UspA family protein
VTLTDEDIRAAAALANRARFPEMGGAHDRAAAELAREYVPRLLAEVRRLRAEVAERDARLRGAEMCDGCAGEGVALGGRPCGCGGTGRLVDMLAHVRGVLFRAEREAAEIRAKALEEAGSRIRSRTVMGGPGAEWLLDAAEEIDAMLIDDELAARPK